MSMRMVISITTVPIAAIIITAITAIVVVITSAFQSFFTIMAILSIAAPDHVTITAEIITITDIPTTDAITAATSIKR